MEDGDRDGRQEAEESSEEEAVILYSFWKYKKDAGSKKVGSWKFEVGEEVFVILYSDRDTGRGHVESFDASADRASVDFKYRIRYLTDQQYDVRVSRLLPVIQGQRIVVCSETQDFRYLCRTQVRKGDSVIEIGCSYGKGTKILAEQAGGSCVVGTDLSAEALKAAKEESKVSNLLRLDVVSCSAEEKVERLNYLNSLLPQPARVLFLDIGGNRSAEDVVQLVPFLWKVVKPHQIIIKNRELFSNLAKTCSDSMSAIEEVRTKIFATGS
eukprot:750930-Hanusia_phi.AAC.6